MKNLKIFNYHIKFNWLEVYIGVLYSWISTSDVLDFVQNDKIDQASEMEYVELYLALDESLYEFMKCLVKYTGKKKLPLDSSDAAIEDLPDKLARRPWKIWELEFMLRQYIEQEKKNMPLSDKIYAIYLLWCDLKCFVDNEKWSPFLWLNNLDCQDEQILYNKFLDHMENLKKELKSKTY